MPAKRRIRLSLKRDEAKAVQEAAWQTLIPRRGGLLSRRLNHL
jgi:hypothetical protein